MTTFWYIDFHGHQVSPLLLDHAEAKRTLAYYRTHHWDQAGFSLICESQS